MNDVISVAVARRYRAETPWGPWSASLATVVVGTLSFAAAIGVVVAAGTGAMHSARNPDHWLAWAPALLSQALMATGALWLAGWFRGRRPRVLALAGPYPAGAAIGLYYLAITSISLLYTFAIFQFWPGIVRLDLDTFAPMVKSSIWPVYALIIVVGAPLSEELLFRGFLQSALAPSRLGYIGASVVTTTSWTLLHIQYSMFGLAEIFVVGLAFCWVLWRSGSLWATIILHALYNGTQFIGLRYELFPWT
jgi:uncharacterized protein